MKEKEISKSRLFCECLFEKCMEWIDFLHYGLIKRDSWVSNLVEYYYIHKNQINKDFVKEFLKGREKTLNNNHYKMIVKELPESDDANVIGKVMLYRKKQYIHQATLKTKDNNEKGNNKLIFWSFEEATENK